MPCDALLCVTDDGAASAPITIITQTGKGHVFKARFAWSPHKILLRPKWVRISAIQHLRRALYRGRVRLQRALTRLRVRRLRNRMTAMQLSMNSRGHRAAVQERIEPPRASLDGNIAEPRAIAWTAPAAFNSLVVTPYAHSEAFCVSPEDGLELVTPIEQVSKLVAPNHRHAAERRQRGASST